jgi:hypothetical protein
MDKICPLLKLTNFPKKCLDPILRENLLLKSLQIVISVKLLCNVSWVFNILVSVCKVGWP